MAQLQSVVNYFMIHLQTLEEKVASLMAGGGGGGVAVAEPILTCVQCQEEYQESQNAEGYCKYHPSPLQNAGWDYVYVVCILCIRVFYVDNIL